MKNQNSLIVLQGISTKGFQGDCMNTTIRKIFYVFLAFCGAAAIFLFVLNAKTNKEFWQVDVTSGFSIIWAVCFSFLATQIFDRQQKKTEIILHLFSAFQSAISEDKTCKFSVNDDGAQILMQKRQINQQLTLLEEYANKFGVKKDVEFLRQKFDEYDQFVSDHINDLQYLSKSCNELSRPIKLMNSRTYKAMLKL